MNKLNSVIFSVTGGATGGFLGVTILDMIEIGISAAIFAFIGGTVGFYTHRLLTKLHKQYKSNNDKIK